MNTESSVARRCSREFRTAAYGAALIAGMMNPLQTQAAEGGLSHFPYGAQTTYAAFMPPPGETTFYGYTLYYDVNFVADDNGKRVPGLDIEAAAIAPRFVHTWKTPFAGFKVSSGFVLQGLYVKVNTPGAQDEGAGPSLVGIEPLILSRSFGNLHILTQAVGYFALGSYDETDLANYTLNYDSVAYQFSTTWTPTPDWDISLNAASEFKGRNKDTDYRGGAQGGLTFGIGHKPFADKRWDLGISGFYTGQFSDDKIRGRKIPGGGRTRKLAIGPKLVYAFAPGTAIVVQYHRETAARFAPQGDLFWIECAIPF